MIYLPTKGISVDSFKLNYWSKHNYRGFKSPVISGVDISDQNPSAFSSLSQVSCDIIRKFLLHRLKHLIKASLILYITQQKHLKTWLKSRKFHGVKYDITRLTGECESSVVNRVSSTKSLGWSWPAWLLFSYYCHFPHWESHQREESNTLYTLSSHQTYINTQRFVAIFFASL